MALASRPSPGPHSPSNRRVAVVAPYLLDAALDCIMILQPSAAAP
jgi:hypothetical protein